MFVFCIMCENENVSADFQPSRLCDGPTPCAGYVEITPEGFKGLFNKLRTSLSFMVKLQSRGLTFELSDLLNLHDHNSHFYSRRCLLYLVG